MGHQINKRIVVKLTIIKYLDTIYYIETLPNEKSMFSKTPTLDNMRYGELVLDSHLIFDWGYVKIYRKKAYSNGKKME